MNYNEYLVLAPIPGALVNFRIQKSFKSVWVARVLGTIANGICLLDGHETTLSDDERELGVNRPYCLRHTPGEPYIELQAEVFNETEHRFTTMHCSSPWLAMALLGTMERLTVVLEPGDQVDLGDFFGCGFGKVGDHDSFSFVGHNFESMYADLENGIATVDGRNTTRPVISETVELAPTLDSLVVLRQSVLEMDFIW